MPCFSRIVISVELKHLDTDILLRALQANKLWKVHTYNTQEWMAVSGTSFVTFMKNKLTLDTFDNSVINDVKRLYSREVVSLAARKYGFIEIEKGEQITLRKYSEL